MQNAATTPISASYGEGRLTRGLLLIFAIAFLLGWLRKRSLTVFVAERVLVGAFSIWLFVIQGGGQGHPRSAAPPDVSAKKSARTAAPVRAPGPRRFSRIRTVSPGGTRDVA